jgi:rhodanese-related sulfurtransferase
MRNFLFLVLLISLLSACSKQPASQKTAENPTIIFNAFASLRQDADRYLQSNPILSISAQEVYDKAIVAADSKYYLVDIRSDEHYAKHHIPGSIHISYADAWRNNKTDFLPKDKKIIIIDYSGHSSSQVAAFWSLLGLEAVPMKHGMAGWSKDKEVVGGSPMPCEARNFPVVKEETAGKTYDLPKLETQNTRAAELLRQRGEAIAAKPVVIQADELMAKVNAKNVFLLDIRAEEHFKAGHISGTLNIPLRGLLEESNLTKLPPDQPIVVVDYDGHAASQAARLLNLLGYDSVALRDGMSVWTGDMNVIGANAVSCAIPERSTAQLNAPANPGPSTAAT